MTQAVVIDEWALVREGISKLLGASNVIAVAAARSATEGFAALERTEAGLVVIGSCPDSSVLAAVRRAHLDPDLRIVAVVGRLGQKSLVELCTSGADAVVLRSSSETELVAAVEHVLRGERYLSPDLLPTLFSGSVRPTPSPSSRFALTTKERAVLGELVGGRTNREIASTLNIGAETVKTHLGNIYAKLDVKRRDEAISVALRGGLV